MCVHAHGVSECQWRHSDSSCAMFTITAAKRTNRGKCSSCNRGDGLLPFSITRDFVRPHGNEKLFFSRTSFLQQLLALRIGDTQSTVR